MKILARACALLSLSLAMALPPFAWASTADTGAPPQGDQGTPAQPKEEKDKASVPSGEMQTFPAEVRGKLAEQLDQQLDGLGKADKSGWRPPAGSIPTEFNGVPVHDVIAILNDKGTPVGLQPYDAQGSAMGINFIVTPEMAQNFTEFSGQGANAATALADNTGTNTTGVTPQEAAQSNQVATAIKDPNGTGAVAANPSNVAAAWNQTSDKAKTDLVNNVQGNNSTTDARSRPPAGGNTTGIPGATPPGTSGTTSSPTGSNGGPSAGKIDDASPVTEATHRGSAQEIRKSVDAFHEAQANNPARGYQAQDPSKTVYGAMQKAENGGISALNALNKAAGKSHQADANKPDDGAKSKSDFSENNPIYNALITGEKVGTLGTRYRRVTGVVDSEFSDENTKSGRR
ncbi:MAG: hypothetical protein WC728_12375 [Elusimicrobiota bacterium]